MRPLTFAALAIYCLGIFNSCQKQIDTAEVDNSDKIKTYTEDVTSAGVHQMETYQVNYDGDGRLASLESTTTPGNRFVYTYHDNDYELEIFSNNTIIIHETFFLNGFSLVDSSFQYNDTGDSTTEKYYYDASHRLIRLDNYTYHTGGGNVSDNITTYEYDGIGNVSKQSDEFGETTFEYYPDLPNPLTYLNPHLSKNRLLVKTSTATIDGEQVVATHTYMFDGQDRLISEKITEDDNDTVVLRTYGY